MKKSNRVNSKQANSPTNFVFHAQTGTTVIKPTTTRRKKRDDIEDPCVDVDDTFLVDLYSNWKTLF
jgi:hypothetical protein